MNIVIHAMHFDATVYLKEFIEKKIYKLEKISDIILDAEVSLKVTKPEVANNKEASIKLIIKNGDLFASKTSDTFEESVILCLDALEKQLIRFKEKAYNK